MALELSCDNMGFSDVQEHTVSGNTLDQIISAMQEHAITQHGYTDEQVHSPEQIAEWQGAVRSASRPGETRTPRGNA